MSLELRFFWKVIQFIVLFVIMLITGLVAYFCAIPQNIKLIKKALELGSKTNHLKGNENANRN